MDFSIGLFAIYDLKSAEKTEAQMKAADAVVTTTATMLVMIVTVMMVPMAVRRTAAMRSRTPLVDGMTTAVATNADTFTID